MPGEERLPVGSSAGKSQVAGRLGTVAMRKAGTDTERQADRARVRVAMQLGAEESYYNPP